MPSKNVHLSQTGRPLCAFQSAKHEQHMLPLSCTLQCALSAIAELLVVLVFLTVLVFILMICVRLTKLVNHQLLYAHKIAKYSIVSCLFQK